MHGRNFFLKIKRIFPPFFLSLQPQGQIRFYYLQIYKLSCWDHFFSCFTCTTYAYNWNNALFSFFFVRSRVVMPLWQHCTTIALKMDNSKLIANTYNKAGRNKQQLLIFFICKTDDSYKPNIINLRSIFFLYKTSIVRKHKNTYAASLKTTMEHKNLSTKISEVHTRRRLIREWIWVILPRLVYYKKEIV